MTHKQTTTRRPELAVKSLMSLDRRGEAWWANLNLLWQFFHYFSEYFLNYAIQFVTEAGKFVYK